MLRKLAHALLAGGVLAIAGTFPFVLHLKDVLPGGELTPAFQRAFYVPWQLYVNLAAGHGPLDAGMIAWGGEGGLSELVGNPGAAFLVAPFHAIGKPALAHALGLLFLGATNSAAGWALGYASARSNPTRLAWIGAALAAGQAWLWMQLGSGFFAAAWLAPGLAALAAVRTERRTLALLAATVGGLAAPWATAAALVSGAMLPGGGVRPWSRGLAVGLGGVALAGTWAPPMNSGMGMDALPLAGLAWPGVDGALGLSLAVVATVVALARRGVGTRLVAGLVATALLIGAGPLVHGPDGGLVRLDGWAIPLGPEGGWAGAYGREVLGAGLTAAIVGFLAVIGTPGRLATLAIVAGLMLEPQLQAWSGQPARLWTGVGFPVPTYLRSLGRVPMRGTILQLPYTSVSEGMIAWIPFHKQRISGGPGAESQGSIRSALTALAGQNPGIGALRSANQGFGASPPAMGGLMSQIGVTQVVVYGEDANLRASVGRLLGPPTASDKWMAAWSVSTLSYTHGGQGMGGPGMQRGAMPPGMSQGGQGGVPPGMGQGGVPPGMSEGGMPPGMGEGGMPKGLGEGGGMPPDMAAAGIPAGAAPGQGGMPPGMGSAGGMPPGMGMTGGGLPPGRSAGAAVPMGGATPLGPAAGTGGPPPVGGAKPRAGVPPGSGAPPGGAVPMGGGAPEDAAKPPG